MDHVEKMIEIKAPPKKVWALMADLERIPEWAKGYTEREVITSKQRTGVGTTTHEVGVAFGKSYEKDFVVTEWEENRKIAYSSTSGWPWKGSWTLKPTKAGTMLTFAVDFELPYGVERLRISFRKRYEKLLEEWVQNMKNIVER